MSSNEALLHVEQDGIGRALTEQPLNRQFDSHEMVARLVEAEMLSRSQEKTAPTI